MLVFSRPLTYTLPAASRRGGAMMATTPEQQFVVAPTRVDQTRPAPAGFIFVKKPVFWQPERSGAVTRSVNRRREVVRLRVAGNIGVARGIDCNPSDLIGIVIRRIGPAEVSGISQRRAALGTHRAEFGHEPPRQPVAGIPLKRARRHRKLIAAGGSRQIKVPGRIHRDTGPVSLPVVTRLSIVARRRRAESAVQTRVEQAGAGGVEHRNERGTLVKVGRTGGVVKSRSRQHRARCRRETCGGVVRIALVARDSRHIGLALRIDRDGVGGVLAWPEESRVHETPAPRTEFGQERALRVTPAVA